MRTLFRLPLTPGEWREIARDLRTILNFPPASAIADPEAFRVSWRPTLNLRELAQRWGTDEQEARARVQWAVEKLGIFWEIRRKKAANLQIYQLLQFLQVYFGVVKYEDFLALLQGSRRNP